MDSGVQCCKAFSTQSDPSYQGILVVESADLKIRFSASRPHHEQDSISLD